MESAPESTRYTFSLTARACLQALAMAAWLEAMIAAHRAVQPAGAGSWLWFFARCLLFSAGAYIVVSVGSSIAKQRAARPRKRDDGEPPDLARSGFDALAFEATAGALLFHFGAPLWMWIFT